MLIFIFITVSITFLFNLFYESSNNLSILLDEKETFTQKRSTSTDTSDKFDECTENRKLLFSDIDVLRSVQAYDAFRQNL